MGPEYTAYVRKMDELRKIAPDESEYWMARDLQAALNYETWRSFTSVIERAKEACKSSGSVIEKHFADASKMVQIGSSANRRLDDVFLSRYACYLIAMNGDPAKPEVGFAQTYFAVQARIQEIQEQLTDAEKRVMLRERVQNANRVLSGVAHDAGVQRFGIFQDAGYRGLYGGLGLKNIKQRKGLPPSSDLLDHAGRAELAANEFRITQTEQKILRDKIVGEENAIHAHHKVGERVRQTIREIGGTMPEDLRPEESVKKLRSAIRKRRKLLPSGSSSSSES